MAEIAALAPPPLAPLSQLRQDPSADARWWAVRALAALPSEDAEAELRAALGDVAPEVRQCAAVGLRGRASLASIARLVESLADPDRSTARCAGDALALAGETAVAALSQAARSESPGVRIEAVRALARARQPNAIPALFHALDDPSSVVAYWADQGLEALGVGMTFFKP